MIDLEPCSFWPCAVTCGYRWYIRLLMRRASLRVRCRLILTGSAGLQEGAVEVETFLFFGRATVYTEAARAGLTTALRNEPIVIVKEGQYFLHDEEANTWMVLAL